MIKINYSTIKHDTDIVLDKTKKYAIQVFSLDQIFALSNVLYKLGYKWASGGRYPSSQAVANSYNKLESGQKLGIGINIDSNLIKIYGMDDPIDPNKYTVIPINRILNKNAKITILK